MREYFDNELQQLNDDLSDMADTTYKMIKIALDNIVNFNENELSNVKQLFDKVVRKEKYIESECMKLLLLQQPVASDLRQISSIMKMINDLQRIGDQVENIAEILEITSKTCLSKDDLVLDMANITSNMLKDSISSFINKDLNLAKDVIKRDDKVDDDFNTIKSQLINIIHEYKNDGEYIIDILMCAKYFEKIGDHCVNIAKWTIYYLTGSHTIKNED